MHARELEGLVGNFGAMAAAAHERSRIVKAARDGEIDAIAWANYYAERAVKAEAKANAAAARLAALEDENAELLVRSDRLEEECLRLTHRVVALQAALAG